MKPPPLPDPPAPKQERSRRTLERILVATEELLEERLFEGMGMAGIAARAGVSVGTIYTRFPSKEAMLPALLERHDAAVEGEVRGLLEDLARARALRARLERLVAFATSYHRRRRGLLRALTMYVRANPDSVPARTLRERQGQYSAVARAVARDSRASIEAVEFVLGVINSVCREQLLFSDVTPLQGRGSSSEEALQRRLVDLAHRYLAGEARRGSGR